MRNLLYVTICCMLVMVLLAQCNPTTVQLFNGKDLQGWEFVLVDDQVDPAEVWSVSNGVIRCSGVPNGYMHTDTDYENYSLTVEWRWVEGEGNSGVLLHAQEPFEVWPRCIESQLKSGSAGDFILMGVGSITVDGERHENAERFLGIPKKEESSEKPIGEWNTYRIICRNDEITCYVNDVLQNQGINSSYSKGRICLQSEGAPIEFRNIQLEQLGIVF